MCPRLLAAQVGLRDGGPAELELAGGRLVVRPGSPATLAELLSGVTPENLHEEWAAGPPAAGGAAVSEAALVCPERGHLVWLSLDPQSGHEQAGRRPALVLSLASYNGPVGLALVGRQVGPRGTHSRCRSRRGCPFRAWCWPLDVKCLDWRTRRAEYVGEAPEGVVVEVVRRLGLLLAEPPPDLALQRTPHRRGVPLVSRSSLGGAVR